MSDCSQCAFRIWSRPAACAAFTDRIPFDIASGQVDHDRPYPGDHGKQFVESPNSARRIMERGKALAASRGVP